MEDPNKTWLRRLFTVECQDATFHPEAFPVVLDKGYLSHVWDMSGKKYIDLNAGFGSLALGHNHPEITKIFQMFFQNPSPVLQSMGDVYPCKAKVELLEEIKKILPAYLSTGALCVTGAQAVEFALKTAHLATKATGFIAFEGGYHGLDLGVLGLCDRKEFREPFLHLLPKDHIEFLPFNCDEKSLRKTIEKQAKIGTAGIFVEPIQGRSCFTEPTPDWLSMLRHVCDEKGILLIYDEVYTGLGRTGQATYASQVPCDLLCLGKTVGGGMPLSACFGKKEYMDAWPLNLGEATNTGTFFGHGLSCLFGTETLRQIAKEDLINKVNIVGNSFKSHLQNMFHNNPLVRSVQGRGLMLGIEFVSPGMGVEIMHLLREKGVLAIPSGKMGECLAMTPALNIGAETLQEASTLIDNCLHRLSTQRTQN